MPLTLPAPLRIRTLTIDPPLILAPMAGLTHCVLRQSIMDFGGIGLLSTEMLSARSLPVESPRVSPYLIRSESEHPLSYQLLVSSASEVSPAIEALHKLNADSVDLNLGCPAPAAVRRGAGVKLMEQPDDVRSIVAEARRRTQLRLTPQIVLGIDDEQRLKDFCSMLQDEGIDLLSVHARMRDESFARKPRWERIAWLKETLQIPVIANGGIFSVQDAKDCLRQSNADGLMIGRAAAIQPWLFAGIAREVFHHAISERAVVFPDLYYAYIDRLNAFRPEYRLGRLKQFTHYFARNYQFGHHLASRVQSSSSVDEARERAAVFFESANQTASDALLLN